MKPTSVTTGICRLSFPNLFTAKGSNLNPEPRFSTDVLIPKSDTATVSAISAAIQAATAEGAEKLWNGKVPTNLKTPLKDGDERDDPNYKGHWILRPWSKEAYPPKVMDANLQPIVDQSEIYGGVYARVNVNFYPYDFNGQKGINCGFDAGVVKVKDGEAFGGGRTSAEDAFGMPGGVPAGMPGGAPMGNTAAVTGAINPLTGLPY